MAKNSSLFSGVTARINENPLSEQAENSESQHQAPKHLSANLDAITNPRAPGQANSAITKTTMQRALWIDPARCRPWDHHNREYSLLNEERCADLISGFRALGKQERPAIVRTIKKSAEEGAENPEPFEFEIISGVRRHWTVSWLREKKELNAKGEPYHFLVVVRDELDTAGAFELSDAENRSQRDISDFERAREYRWALCDLYDDNISTMASAIQIDRSNLSRLLALTEMPEPIVLAYPSILDIRTHHWRKLGAFFKNDDPATNHAREKILECAETLKLARQNGSSKVPNDGPSTIATLLKAAEEKKEPQKQPQVLQVVNASKTGKVAMQIKRVASGLSVEIKNNSGASAQELQDAFEYAMKAHYSP